MPNQAKKAVFCVFDGLRPDRVTEEHTPNLWRFANAGTWFRESRSVFPSVTRVATTSFATGSKPQTHGIVDNAFFHLPVIGDRPLDLSSREHIEAAEAHHNGRFVQAPGMGCALAEAGKTYSVVHTGSAGSTYLVNHRARANGHWTFSIHGAEATQTPEAVETAIARFGPLPKSDPPKFDEVDYGTRVLTEHVLPERRPDVALIWFAEPDTAYHYCEIGSPQSVEITRRVDRQFGAIVEAIAAAPDADETVIVAMSDHGQIATLEEFDLFATLTEAGFPAKNRVEDGIEVFATRGAAVGLSLRNADKAALPDLAGVLMDLPETGLVFSRTEFEAEGRIAGTLPYSLVGLDHERAPDLVWVARSSLKADQHGLAGSGLFTGGVPVGGGMHGGLNPHELNTMLAFGGAGLPALGQIADPADLTDIVPTVLTLLGVPVPPTMTGRPLAAVTGKERPELTGETVSSGRGSFEQSVTIATGGPRPVVLSGGRGV